MYNKPDTFQEFFIQGEPHDKEVPGIVHSLDGGGGVGFHRTGTLSSGETSGPIRDQPPRDEIQPRPTLGAWRRPGTCHAHAPTRSQTHVRWLKSRK